MTKKMNRDFLISELIRFQEENGRMPGVVDMKNAAGFPSSKPYINEFGSWKNAISTIRPNPDDNFFHPDNMTLQKWYIIGYIIGDGCVVPDKRCNSPTLKIITTEKDKTNLYKMHQYMGITTKIYIHHVNVPNQQTQYTIETHNKKWCSHLSLYGIVPQKSFISHIPLDFLENPFEEAAIMRGILDSDGCVYAKKNGHGLGVFPGIDIVGSNQLCEDYNYLLKKNVGLTFPIRKNGNVKVLSICGFNKCQPVYDFLYNHDNFFIKRKKERLEKLLNRSFTKENDPYYT